MSTSAYEKLEFLPSPSATHTSTYSRSLSSLSSKIVESKRKMRKEMLGKRLLFRQSEGHFLDIKSPQSKAKFHDLTKDPEDYLEDSFLNIKSHTELSGMVSEDPKG